MPELYRVVISSVSHEIPAAITSFGVAAYSADHAERIVSEWLPGVSIAFVYLEKTVVLNGSNILVSEPESSS